MKTNEAPKKIYCHRNELGYLAYSDQPFNYAKEYIRTDVFIEKAVNWLSEHANDYIINDICPLPNGEMSRDWLKIKSDMFSDFKNHMKGE